jgi:proteic killer suppression protein
LHRLQGSERHWSIRVNGKYRLTFAFEDEDAILLDYRDYH